MGGLRLSQHVFAAIGGDQDDNGRFGEAKAVFDPGGRFNAIHAGHFPIHQNQVVTRSVGLLGLFQHLQGFVARSGCLHLPVKVFQHHPQNIAPGFVIIHDENA